MGPAGRHPRRDVNIRRYRDADFAAVVALWDACGLTVPYNDPARDIPFLRDSPNAQLFVADEDGRLVGTIMLGHDGHRGWLYRLAVASDCRGRGFGRALVGEAERWLAARGVAQVNLMIRGGNAAVRDVYARLGYAVEPRIVMSRWLDESRRPADDGGIDVVIAYLEMTAPPTRPTVPAPPAKLALLRAENPPVAFYRYLYDNVGEPWFWIDRRKLDDAALAAILADPLVELYVLYVGGVPAGYVELDRRTEPDINLAYCGLIPEFTGRGLGPWLLNWAVDAAWRHRPRRLTVDTCTLDHPKALAVYQRAGFVPYRQERKTIDDPRRTGLIRPHFEPRRP